MSQQRLTGLTTICIEKELTEQLNYGDIISDFVCKKARKIKQYFTLTMYYAFKIL